MNFKELVEKTIDDYMPSLLLLLEDCVAIESYSGQEKKVADYLLDYFKKHNILSARTPRGSVISLFPPNEIVDEVCKSEPINSNNALEIIIKTYERIKKLGYPIVAYNAHMDIVDPGEQTQWRFPPFKLTYEDNKVFGRGTCDMKGGLSCLALSIIVANKLRKLLTPKISVLACFVTEEEVAEGLAFKEIISDLNLKPNAVLLAEPSQMNIARGQRGKLEFFIRAEGKRAHTSVPEAGENAAYKIAKAIIAIESLDRGEYRRIGPDPNKILERTTLVATGFRTIPFTKSFVPDKAEALVIVRLAKGETLSSIKQKLVERGNWPDDITVDQVFYKGVSYTGVPSEWQAYHPCWELSIEHPFYQFIKKAYYKILLKEPTPIIWPFSTDGAFSAGHMNIPTLGIGPGREDVAHTINEYVEISQLRQALKFYSFLPFMEDFAT